MYIQASLVGEWGGQGPLYLSVTLATLPTLTFAFPGLPNPFFASETHRLPSVKAPHFDLTVGWGGKGPGTAAPGLMHTTHTFPEVRPWLWDTHSFPS